MRDLVCLVLLSLLHVSAKKRLALSDVCEEYIRCSDEKEIYEKTCGIHMHNNYTKTLEEASCENELKNDLKLLVAEKSLIKQQTTFCIRTAVKYSMVTKFNKAKAKFCYPYMFGEQLNDARTSDECFMTRMRLENRCNALKQCCNPSSRCEQSSQHGQTGRTIQGLEEEIQIKMAACKARVSSSKTGTRDTHDTSSTEQIALPPFSLCQRYLRCSKEMFNLRNRCAALRQLPKAGNEYSWSPAYNFLAEPLDARDAYCKKKYSKKFSNLLERRNRAEMYLDHCTPIANLTRELIEKQQPCEPSLLLDLESPISDLDSSTCLLEVAIRKQQCALLRNCCIQADVCERNAMYGVLADDYLLSQTELKTDMDTCYHSK